jgi:uncharacterized protein (TIGR03067 family)
VRWWLAALVLTAGAAHAGEREEQLRFQGTWGQLEGGPVSQPQKVVNQQMTVAGMKITFSSTASYTLHLAPTREPRELDLRPLDGKDEKQWFKGIYTLDGDTLIIYYAPLGQARPSNFRDANQNGTAVYLMKFRRVRQNQ